jgi:parallel beta-helix repeat protein
LAQDGTLLIDGAAGNPVTIRPNQREYEVGSWDGIFADPEGKLEVYHADISHAEFNLRADTGSKITIEESALKFAEDASILFRSAGVLKVNRCTITDNEGDGIRVEGFTLIPDTVLIENSTIRFNQGNGIVIDLYDPMDEKVIKIEGNTIQANSFHGIQLKNEVYPKINQNAIFNNDIFNLNGGYDLRLEPPFGGMFATGINIDGRNNFWGAAFALRDSSQVADLMIYDSSDDVNIKSYVRYVPWLNIHP